MSDLSSRQAAARALAFILDQGRTLDEALSMARVSAIPEPRERAFARTIISTTLRRLGRIDRALAEFIKRPLPDNAHAARAILRSGAAQLLFLDTPAYAAVDRMTSLAAEDARAFKGLVNAVLRRVSERGREVIADMTEEDDWPAWLVESWRKAYGPETARAIAIASGQEPPLDLTVKVDPERWASALEGTVTPLGGVRVARGGDLTAWEGFDEGAWWVQDAAASLPAKLLLSTLETPASARVLDLCAAPGGKTLQLASAGCAVTAVDRSARRLERLKGNLARTGLAAEVVEGDAAAYEPDALVDAVLLDAPCSATGTLRRRPDVAWNKSEKDVRAMGVAQVRLIAAAARMLRPGGALVFCTCSLQPEEGPDSLAAALEGGAPLKVDPINTDEIPGLPPEAIGSDGTVRTLPSFWPESGGMDGFFIARLRRAP